MDKLERFPTEDQRIALQALQKVWEKMAGGDTQEVQEALEEAIRTTRSPKASAQG
ncbi:MAG: hypothetical protein WCD80_06930 [Desulfobaccales bacterium]